MALYKRPGSKYWWMKFTFDGELVQKSTAVTNKRDAATIESAYRTQLALGKIGIEVKQKAPTFKQAADDFLELSKIKHAQKIGSYRRYLYSCQTLRNYFGRVKVDQIKPKNVQDFIVWRSGQTSRKTKELITRETVNHELLTLKILFNNLVDARILRENPARKIKQLKANELSFHVIKTDEEKLYLMACPQPLQDVAILMLETGMRCGEVYQLRRQDVLLEKSYLNVYKGKTKSSKRRIHLSERARKVLQYRLDKFKGENLFPHNEQDGNEPIKGLDKLHLATIRKLRMKFRLYDCRHTFASRAVENRVDLLVLASILGHSNLQMVMRYAHPSETFKADAIRLMEKEKTAKAV